MPTITTEKPSPPRSVPNNCPIVVSRTSAMRDFSSTTPIKTKSGTAISTGFVITPKNRVASDDRRFASNTPISAPMTAKMIDNPPSAKATR